MEQVEEKRYARKPPKYVIRCPDGSILAPAAPGTLKPAPRVMRPAHELTEAQEQLFQIVRPMNRRQRRAFISQLSRRVRAEKRAKSVSRS